MTTTGRGLGWEHQQARAWLLARLVPGTPCPLCAGPMYGWDKLDADHVIPRVLGGVGGPLRLAHTSCNRRAGAILKRRLIAVAGRCSRCCRVGAGRGAERRLVAAAVRCPDCRAKVLATPTRLPRPQPAPIVTRPALAFFDTHSGKA